MSRPACMSDREWRAWLEANERLLSIYRSESPCRDCTAAFAAEMRHVGRCDGEPVRRWCRQPVPA
jgi:hypothetical protein